MTASIHLYSFDRSAVAVPSRGNPLGEKYRMGAFKCVLCRLLASFVADWADCDCCAGVVADLTVRTIEAESGKPLVATTQGALF